MSVGKNGQVWTTDNIEVEKQRVRDELDKALSGQKRTGRLALALKRVEELNDDASDQGLLSRYVYAMSALVHHETSGGLKPGQIRGLLDIAHGILQVKIPRPATSRLANLYGEHYLLRSQLARQEGLHWQAAWDQQMSCHVSGRILSQGEARQALAAGIRAMRLADGPLALEHFLLAENGGLPARQWVRARLGQIQCHRLAAHWTEARRLIAETAAKEEISDVEQRDLGWQSICLEAQTSGRLDDMLRSVAFRGSHHEPSYFLETLLWSRCSRDRQWRERLPTLASQARSRSLKVHHQGLLYRSVEAVENCYDTTIPFHIRLERLGRILEKRQGLISIDKELLLLGAASVWLRLNRAASLARITQREYQATCRRLSDGRSEDVLSLLADETAETLASAV